jgi:hypothetical protein
MDTSISQRRRLERKATQGQVCVLLNRYQLLTTRIGPDDPYILRGNCEPTAQLPAHGIRSASRVHEYLDVPGHGHFVAGWYGGSTSSSSSVTLRLTPSQLLSSGKRAGSFPPRVYSQTLQLGRVTFSNL